MQKSGTIILQGHFEQSGFGFSCLRQATALHITGRFEYINADKVEIIIAGSESAIQNFHQWCTSQKNTTSSDLKILTESNYYQEFEIVNHL